MPVFRPAASEDDFLRGRTRTTKCLFSKALTTKNQGELIEEFNKEPQTLKKEWFTGHLDIEEQNEADDTMKCSCGQKNKLTNRSAGTTSIGTKLSSYPAYLIIRGTEAILVKGTTGQLVMQLYEEDVVISKIARKLAKQQAGERYSTDEVRTIIRTCSLHGLTGQTPVAAKSWENEPIEGWWLKDDSHCEVLRREQPVGKGVTGYDSEAGWWRYKQCAKHRDWSRWGYRSIGPEDWRRGQRRQYDLNGSEALRTDGGG